MTSKTVSSCIDPLCDVASASREGRHFDTVADEFQWVVPDMISLGVWLCERHTGAHNQLALIAEREAGGCQRYTFNQLSAASAKLARLMLDSGVRQGDRVAVILPQRVETALAHLAAQRIGAVSLPLSILFGDDALRYRLNDSGTVFVIVTDERFELVDRLRQSLPQLQTIVRVTQVGPVALSDDGCLKPGSDVADDRGANGDDIHHRAAVMEPLAAHRTFNFWQAIESAAPYTDWLSCKPSDPAFLLYTSGTTGPPKGALIPQSALLGNLTGFECSHNGFPSDEDVVFTPADWAWTGGLLDALLPAWFYGVPVVALDAKKFDPVAVVSLIARHRVTCAFIPPTALKMIRAVPQALQQQTLALRSVMSAGETLGDALLAWGEQALGLTINEMCGQTEHNYLIGNCRALMPVKPGSMGKAYPGHRVAIMGPDGDLLPDGEIGEIVADKQDPVHFLGYWNNPEATKRKYTGDWFHTGDMGCRDSEGYLWFQGRADDVISSAGYRIGPGEIENCALTHEAVVQAAAIAVPDPNELRGDVVKLCVVLREDAMPCDELKQSLQDHIRGHLAAYEYPRVIEFFDELPTTTTGKVQRNVLREWHHKQQN